ncbi:hypothetical protein BSLG_004489 [Batrachochytrium salamandrivorans]|nr:hypothetical protein BASA60_011412 [Batrachochytrium salamandrivorans]KAH9248743.1 hypothetical protein BASA81_013584 [Batrachochytrium salamandrivorans]KAH9276029.1 hypothetical protein BASA83_001302 [Batrachochytrium salamandrivorans]KAJ1341019.1 hypothetical protein BSLG_004489 [Batrachochytrium salamandrivorans]
MSTRQSKRFLGSADLMDMIYCLPIELRNQIYKEAGPLTRYFHNELIHPISRPTASQIMVECFKTNNLDALEKGLCPQIELSFETMFLSTSKMWAAACSLPRVSGCEADMASKHSVHCIFPISSDGCEVRHIDKHSMLGMTAMLCMPVIDPLTLRLLNDALDVAMTSPQSLLDPQLASKLVECASGLGRIDIVKVALAHVIRPSWHAFLFAGLHGHLEVLKMLCDHGSQQCLTAYGAVAGGHVDIAEHIRKSGSLHMVTESAVQFALGSGRVDTVWWMFREPSYWTHSAFGDIKNMSATMGNMDMLLFTIEHNIGGPLTSDGANGAAKNGHLSILKWIYSHYENMSSKVALILAAEHGHFETFVWLCENTHWSLDEVDICQASRNGHLWIVEYYAKYISTGSLDQILVSALSGGRIELAELLIETGRTTPNASMMLPIATAGNVAGVKWLHQKIDGTYSSECIEMACRNNQKELVLCLIDTCHIRITPEIREEAAINGSIELVQSLYQRDPLSDWSAARLASDSNQDMDVATWLEEQITSAMLTMNIEENKA